MIKLLKIFKKSKTIKSKKNLIVGEGTLYNEKINIVGAGKVEVGKYCAFGPNLTIISSNHNYNLPALQIIFYKEHFGKTPTALIKGKTIIGNDVWTGNNVIILNGIKVGNGVCIGAGSVVTKDVPDYAIVAGVPAKIIKYRFNKKIINFLLELKWWDWDKKRIKQNKTFFYTNLNKNESIDKLKKVII